jgi:DNA repair protein RadC
MIIKISDKQRIKITTPQAIFRLFQDILKTEDKVDKDKEHFWVVGLDTRNIIKYVELVSLGTLNASLVHPREVFRTAISQGVAQIILGHNHPSGDATPSEDDLEINIRLIT